MPVVVNLGGEGEVPGAVNVNLGIEVQMFNRRFADGMPPQLLIRRSAHDTGLPDGSVDEVIAQHFPIQFDQFIADAHGHRAPIAELAAEVVRILKPDGVVRFGCSSCDRDALAAAFMKAGLRDVRVGRDGLVEGTAA